MNMPSRIAPNAAHVLSEGFGPGRLATEPRIDILLNNAGAMFARRT